MASSLEARLQYLETREDANTRDIIKLKLENAELQTKVCDLKRENLQATEKMKEMETCCRKLESDMKDVFGFRNDIDTRVTRVESSVSRLKDNHDRVSSLESNINHAHQEMTSRFQSLAQRLDELQRRQECQPQPMPEGARTEEETLVKSLMLHDSSCETEEGGLVSDRLKTLESKTQDIQKSVQRLQEIRDDVSQSLVFVEISPSQNIVKQKNIKLDRISDVCINGGYFNVDSCCLNPQRAGDYLVYTNFIQYGTGAINLFLKIEGNPVDIFQGKTLQKDDLTSSMRIVRLAKGQKLWLEARREAGNAQVGGCDVVCWLLSPTT